MRSTSWSAVPWSLLTMIAYRPKPLSVAKLSFVPLAGNNVLSSFAPDAGVAGAAGDFAAAVSATGLAGAGGAAFSAAMRAV
jgi:hypothetical protein